LVQAVLVVHTQILVALAVLRHRLALQMEVLLLVAVHLALLAVEL